jgi:hypothetical protein
MARPESEAEAQIGDQTDLVSERIELLMGEIFQGLAGVVGARGSGADGGEDEPAHCAD